MILADDRKIAVGQLPYVWAVECAWRVSVGSKFMGIRSDATYEMGCVHLHLHLIHTPSLQDVQAARCDDILAACSDQAASVHTASTTREAPSQRQAPKDDLDFEIETVKASLALSETYQLDVPIVRRTGNCPQFPWADSCTPVPEDDHDDVHYECCKTLAGSNNYLSGCLLLWPSEQDKRELRVNYNPRDEVAYRVEFTQQPLSASYCNAYSYSTD